MSLETEFGCFVCQSDNVVECSWWEVENDFSAVTNDPQHEANLAADGEYMCADCGTVFMVTVAVVRLGGEGAEGWQAVGRSPQRPGDERHDQ